jgi:hypothetical protein
MRNGPSMSDFKVTMNVLSPKTSATGISVKSPTDPDGKEVEQGLNAFSFYLYTKTLS